MIPANKEDKNLDSIFLRVTNPPPPPSNYLSYKWLCLILPILISYNYNIESCSLVGLNILYSQENMKRDWAEPQYDVERVDYQVFCLLMHKTDIIKSTLGCIIKKNQKNYLCTRELPGWIEIMNIKHLHVPLQCTFYLLQSLHNVP